MFGIKILEPLGENDNESGGVLLPLKLGTEFVDCMPE